MSETLYERDYHAWIFDQARRIRTGEPIDRENVAEELESLGISQRNQLRNRLAMLLMHLIKWQFQPEKRSPSWMATIKEQRRAVNELLEEMPSLKHRLRETIQRAYQTGVYFAIFEMRTMVEEDLPSECPYSIEQILDPQYLP